MSATSDTVRKGSLFDVIFEVTVTNHGPEPASDVLLHVARDPATEGHIEDQRLQPPPGATCDSDALMCHLGELRAAESATVRSLARVPALAAPTGITMEFRASSKTLDGVPCDNNFFSSAYLEPRNHVSGGGAIGFCTFLLLTCLRTCWRKIGKPANSSQGACGISRHHLACPMPRTIPPQR